MRRSLASVLTAFLLFGVMRSAHAQGGGSVDSALQQGLAPFLLVCFTGGLLALLTPCVFPMVPVTISFFAKRTASPIKGAVAYCLGIIGTFAIIGVAVAVLFGATKIQAFATSPWVNLALGSLFVVLAMNLFGLFELNIRLPGKLAEVTASKNSPLWVPVVMGFAFTLTSFTCTAPIVGSLLVIAAKGGNVIYPMLGMASFGLAFSLPFLLLALFPSALSKVPKSGAWLGAIKPALGFLELAAAVKFFSNADLAWQLGILKRPAFLAIWGVVGLGLALYLFGFPRSFAITGWFRRGLGLAALLGAAFMVLAISPSRLSGPSKDAFNQMSAFLPPDPYNLQLEVKPAAVGAPVRVATFAEAVALAKSSHKDIFVDFTGAFCTNCRWMESNVFPVPSVKAQFDRLINVQLYTDRNTPSDNANQKLQQQLTKTVALPVYAIIRPDGSVAKTFEGKSQTADEFLNFLVAGQS